MLDNTFQITILIMRNLISQKTFLPVVAILLFVLSGCKTTETQSVQDTEQLMPNLKRPEVPQRTIMSIPGGGGLRPGP